MHIVLLKCPHVQIAFLKFTSCDNQYSNCCCRCSFEPEIIKIGQSSHKMYSNKILNFQVSTILNACTKSLEPNWMHHIPHYVSWIINVSLIYSNVSLLWCLYSFDRQIFLSLLFPYFPFCLLLCSHQHSDEVFG